MDVGDVSLEGCQEISLEMRQEFRLEVRDIRLEGENSGWKGRRTQVGRRELRLEGEQKAGWKG